MRNRRQVGVEAHDFDNWFFQILDELQNEQEVKGKELDELFSTPNIPTMSDAERHEALAYLRRPELVHSVLADMETLGYMGDEVPKLLGT